MISSFSFPRTTSGNPPFLIYSVSFFLIIDSSFSVIFFEGIAMLLKSRNSLKLSGVTCVVRCLPVKSLEYSLLRRFADEPPTNILILSLNSSYMLLTYCSHLSIR